MVAVRYHVRMALVDLDSTPQWFKKQSRDHMCADAARAFARTNGTHRGLKPGVRRCSLSVCMDSHSASGVVAGKVQLLTHPMAAGYIQNPISVYYCYSASGTLSTCIAEVTNTPWCVARHRKPHYLCWLHDANIRCF